VARSRIDFAEASKCERSDYPRIVLFKFTGTGEINVAMVETAGTIGSLCDPE
jgi:hypothetical protein